MRADIHMHSNFSHDSEHTPEEMVLGAIEKGLKVICFTDHYDKDDFAWGQEDVFDPEEYFRVMKPLQKKYNNQIDMRIGVEIGMQPYLEPFYREFVKKYPFDFVIGSVHSIRKSDIAHRDIFQEYSDDDVYRMTLEETLEDVRLYDDFDTLGHLDYVKRYVLKHFGEETGQLIEEEHAEVLTEILKEIIRRDIALEVNTGSLRYGYSFTNPSAAILQRYRELGGQLLTLGSDAHTAAHVGGGFDTLPAMLTELGFTSYVVFRQRVGTEMPLME